MPEEGNEASGMDAPETHYSLLRLPELISYRRLRNVVRQVTAADFGQERVAICTSSGLITPVEDVERGVFLDKVERGLHSQ